MKRKKKILLVLTGGTFCSSAEPASGERAAHADRAGERILTWFRDRTNLESDLGMEVEWTTSMPLNLLSENMTAAAWNLLIAELRACDPASYDGLILVHGTDTLAYTSSLMALLMEGCNLPVLLVASQLPLDEEASNGYDNFAEAAALIMRGIPAGVYVPYRNSGGDMVLHRGGHLRQCVNYSDDFESADALSLWTRRSQEERIDYGREGAGLLEKGRPCQSGPASPGPLLYRVGELSESVLRIEPYVGIRYDRYLLDGVGAVLHGVYHAETACVGEGERDVSSALSLLSRCRGEGIPFFLSPCRPESWLYVSTGQLMRSGALALSGMTGEMAYVKLVLALSLGLAGDSLTAFMQENLCGEIFMP